jgi:hypothetical protein
VLRSGLTVEKHPSRGCGWRVVHDMSRLPLGTRATEGAKPPMQTPTTCLGGVIYRALPAYLAHRPPSLAHSAEWVVVIIKGGRQEGIAGWIAVRADLAARYRGRGRLACFTGGDGAYGPPLAYLRNARSSRQATRLIAEAHAASQDAAEVASSPRRSRGAGDR